MSKDEVRLEHKRALTKSSRPKLAALTRDYLSARGSGRPALLVELKRNRPLFTVLIRSRSELHDLFVKHAVLGGR